MMKTIPKRLSVYDDVNITIQYEQNREATVFQTLRNTQGLHAPLQLQMERKITSKVSHTKSL